MSGIQIATYIQRTYGRYPFIMAGDLYLRAEHYALRPTPYTLNGKIDAPLALLNIHLKTHFYRIGIERRQRHCLTAINRSKI